MKGRVSFFMGIFICFIYTSTIAQLRISKEEYIETYKSIAVREMLKYGIPASITLAQGMLESGDGNSRLAQNAKNHFGIKCHGEWEGDTYHQDDDKQNECFRKYKHAEESYEDHSSFLKTRERYSDLFKLKHSDYEGWAKGLKAAGYATNPKYPELIVKIIRDWKLFEYDKLNELPSEWSRLSNVNKESSNKKAASKASTKNHEVYNVNNIKTVTVKPNDTWESVSKEFGMGSWEIYRYNEIDKAKKPIVGEIIYLQPKRRRSNEGCHTVVGKESLWEISQKYGLKMKLLKKRNSLNENSQLSPGQKILLKSKGCK